MTQNRRGAGRHRREAGPVRRIWDGLHAALAAVMAQGLTALGSVIVQVFAARQLGASGYGAFTVVNGVLLVVLAVQNGWVGDSLTVLNRWNPRTRSALTVSQLGFLLAGALLCGGAGYGYGSWGVALPFALMAVAYLSGELCRRIFMARREFWALSINNLVFVLSTWVVLEIETRSHQGSGLGTFAFAVAAGSAVGVAAAMVQLPLSELRPGQLSFAGMSDLMRFAVWRSAQIGVRPLALLVTRLIVVAVSGRAVLGQVEGARLLMAPATTFTQGVGSFILPMYAAEARGETGARVKVTRITAAVVGVTVALSALPLLFPGPAQHLLTKGSFSIPTGAAVAWAVFSVAFAFGLPSANQLVARRMSREVLLVRLVDALVGLTAVALIAGFGAAHEVAIGLATGAFVGAFLTLRMATRNRAVLVTAEPALEPVS